MTSNRCLVSLSYQIYHWLFPVQGLESFLGHPRVVIVQSQPGNLDQSLSGVVMTVGSAVRKLEKLAHPHADLGGDPGREP